MCTSPNCPPRALWCVVLAGSPIRFGLLAAVFASHCGGEEDDQRMVVSLLAGRPVLAGPGGVRRVSPGSACGPSPVLGIVARKAELPAVGRVAGLAWLPWEEAELFGHVMSRDC